MYRRFFFIVFLEISLQIMLGNKSFAEINLPPNPVFIAPPPVDENEYNEQILQREKTQKEENKEETASPKTKRDLNLSAEAKKERPLVFFVQTRFLLPKIATNEDRHGYTVDPTLENELAIRLFQSRPIDGFNFWLGWRAAYFSGAGIHKTQTGRYAFTYFGPAIILSWLEQSAKIQEPDRNTAKDTDKRLVLEEFPKKTGWLLHAGSAILSRTNRSIDENKDNTSDFYTTLGAKPDGPGLWLNLDRVSVHFGALGVHCGVGIQTGLGKRFYWVHAAFSGWY